MVPVVVSAGLAVGVFCGLLFGLGTGKKRANAEPPIASNNVKKEEAFTPESLANPNVKLPGKDTPAAASGAGSGSAAGAGSGSAAGAGSGSAAEPARLITTLIVEIAPPAAAQGATVYVDGREIVGKQLEVALDPGATKKKVVVQVKAPNFKDVEQETELEGESVTLKIEMAKGRTTPPPPAPIDPAPPTATKTPTPTPTPKAPTNGTPPPARPKPPKQPAGGLIDI